MKRLNSSDSLGALICPPADEDAHGYGRDYPVGAYEEEEVPEKKRRLGMEQVRALEKNFEAENKLEPERKARLAHELGLQPRQVAVWFQNRRARWKTKQLERDYAFLKADYDSLSSSFDAVRHENEALAQEIRELKSKLKEENSETTVSVKKELNVSETDEPKPDSSDSSAILNSPNSHHFSDPKIVLGDANVKMEEHEFFSGDEACDFFSDDQPPTLQWYCSDQWS